MCTAAHRPSRGWLRSSACAGRVAQVKDLPDHLEAWEAGGRKAFDFMTDDDPFPADATEIKMPKGITALPGWLCRHSALQTLNLHRCKALTSLPAELGRLTSLWTLILGSEYSFESCGALTGMPDLSGLPQLQARRTMAGGMSECIVVPERCLVPLAPGVSARDACLVEPLAVAIHGLRLAGVRGDHRVAVVGGGTIGLCAVAAVTGLGAPVALVARHDVVFVCHRFDLFEQPIG